MHLTRNFASMLDLAPLTIAVMKYPSGIILDTNLAWEKIFGWTKEESIGKTTLDLGFFYIPEQRQKIYQQLATDGQVRETEIHIKTKDGKFRMASLSIDLIDVQGELYALGILDDVTDEFLERHRLQAVVANSPSVLGIKDRNGVYVVANPNYSKILGYPIDSVLGKKDADFLPEALARKIAEIDKIVIDTCQKIVVEENMPTASGEIRNFVTNKFPIFDTQGNVESVCSISIDVTERKHFENEFRTTFDQATVGIAHVSFEGKWIKANQALCKYLGFTEEELFAMTFMDVTHPDDRTTDDQAIISKLISGELKRHIKEKRYIKKDGSVLWASVHIGLARNHSGKPVHLITCVSDLSAQKHAQLELEKAISARDEFISIASHELKTPLSSLKLQAQIAKRSREQGDMTVYDQIKVDRLIDLTDKQVGKLNRLVDDMLDFSRIQTGHMRLHKESFKLSDLVREVLDRLGPNFKDAQIPVSFESTETPEGEWDHFRIEQVVTNLMTNAMRYGNQKPVKVILKLGSAKKSVLLIVRDQGEGISEENKTRIFDRFERAVDANEVSGLGLGLYISKQIIEDHGGKIWVESRPGIGSDFYVELPLLSNGSFG